MHKHEISVKEASVAVPVVGPVVYHELPEASQNLRLWEMTAEQQALTQMAANFRTEGVEIRFESDELDKRAVRFVQRINHIIALMDDHTIDFNRFHETSPALVSESALNTVNPSVSSLTAGPRPAQR